MGFEPTTVSRALLTPALLVALYYALDKRLHFGVWSGKLLITQSAETKEERQRRGRQTRQTKKKSYVECLDNQ